MPYTDFVQKIIEYNNSINEYDYVSDKIVIDYCNKNNIILIDKKNLIQIKDIEQFYKIISNYSKTRICERCISVEECDTRNINGCMLCLFDLMIQNKEILIKKESE